MLYGSLESRKGCADMSEITEVCLEHLVLGMFLSVTYQVGYAPCLGCPNGFDVSKLQHSVLREAFLQA